jgi:hypothetical protein
LVSQLQSEAASLGQMLIGHVERWNRASDFWRHIGFEIAEGDDMYQRISWIPGSGRQ